MMMVVTMVLPPGALIVVVDMSLAMMSVLTNLMVITSIRRKEEMMAVTFNMVSYTCHHTRQKEKLIILFDHLPLFTKGNIQIKLN